MGTTLALFWLLWALIAGRFLRSRGAVVPARADLGLPADAVRRSGAALTYGCWTIQSLLDAWHHRVQQEGRWQAPVYAGFRPVVCDLVGFCRPQLNGWGGGTTSPAPSKPCRPLPSRWGRRSGRLAMGDGPGCVCSCGLTRVMAAKRSCNTVPSRKPERLGMPTTCSWSTRGAGGLTCCPVRFRALWREWPAPFQPGVIGCRPTKGGGGAPSMASAYGPCLANVRASSSRRRPRMRPPTGWALGGESGRRSGLTWSWPTPSQERRGFAVWSSTTRAIKSRGSVQQTCPCRPRRGGGCPVTAGPLSRRPWRQNRCSARTAHVSLVVRVVPGSQSWRC